MSLLEPKETQPVWLQSVDRSEAHAAAFDAWLHCPSGVELLLLSVRETTARIEDEWRWVIRHSRGWHRVVSRVVGRVDEAEVRRTPPLAMAQAAIAELLAEIEGAR